MHAQLLVAILFLSQGQNYILSPGPPALARIRSGNGFGTGFLIDKNEERAYILTAGHVLGRGAIVVEFSNGQRYAGRSLGVDPYYDLGLIEIAPPDIEPVALAETNTLGQLTYGMGFGKSGRYRYYNGKLTDVADGANVLQSPFFPPDINNPGILMNAGSEEGDSGGPFVNENSEVCGVISATNGYETVGPSVDHIKSFLDRRGPLRRIVRLRSTRFKERYTGPLPTLPPLIIE